jgi:hypothetical protein
MRLDEALQDAMESVAEYRYQRAMTEPEGWADSLADAIERIAQAWES